MRTATANDLLTRLSTVLAWLEDGEEVVLKPQQTKPAAKLKTESPAMLPAEDVPRVNQSIVFSRPHQVGHLNMTKEELQEFYEDMRGTY